MIIGTIGERIQQVNRQNEYVTPGFVAALFTAFLIFDLSIKPGPDSSFIQENGIGVTLALLQTLPLVFMRKAPMTVLLVVYAAFIVHASFFDYSLLWPAQLSSLAVLYQVASGTNDRKSLVGAIISFTVVIVILGVVREEPDTIVILLVLFATVWITGNIVRSRRNRLEIAEITVVELVDEQETVARDAIRRERVRITRELHDVLGHTLNLMVIQAGAGESVVSDSEVKAIKAFKSIESTGRQALDDVDRMLGILRDADDDSAMSDSLQARPSIDRLSSLVEDLRSTGQTIEFSIIGIPTKLSPSTDLSAYRVAQEALTNVMTHASGSTAIVTIEYAARSLSVTIQNDQDGAERKTTRSGGGRGIIGMRERTRLFGGNFEAGQTDVGGWLVRATFPLVTDETKETTQ